MLKTSINKLKQQFRDWSASMSFGKKILIMLLLPLIIETLLLLLFFRVYLGWSEADKWVIHSQEIYSKTAIFQRSLLEARASARSYALFGDEHYITDLHNQMNAYKSDYYQLKQLVSDNSEQIASLENLEKDILAFDTYLSLIKFQASGASREIAELFVMTKDGERLLNQLIDKLDVFTSAELKLDEKRKKEQKSRVSEAATVIFAGGAALLFITLFLGLVYQYAVKERFNELMQSVNNYAMGKPFERKLSGKDEMAVLEQAFFQMAKSLRARSIENEAFIYGVSHDMRSPLVNLHGFADELQYSIKEIESINDVQELTNETRKRLDRIVKDELPKSTKFITSAVARLSTIIDGLLKLSRIGRVDYEWKLFDPNIIIEKIILALDVSIRSKNATTQCERLPKIFSDSAAFEQIFANLITNAVNYLDPSRAGVINVGIAQTNNNESVTIYVKDNGMGFPENYKGKIFLPFQRYHTKSTTGEGIGLAIVQRIVEKLNAQIWVESEVDVGTTFFVTFPNASSILREYEKKLKEDGLKS